VKPADVPPPVPSGAANVVVPGVLGVVLFVSIVVWVLRSPAPAEPAPTVSSDPVESTPAPSRDQDQDQDQDRDQAQRPRNPPRPAPPPPPADAPQEIAASHVLVMYRGSMRAPETITRTREEALALSLIHI
jgi:hypothetical protein